MGRRSEEKEKMYNNKHIRKVAVVLCWILVLMMVLSTCSYFVFAEEGNGGEVKTFEDPQVITETAISLQGALSDSDSPEVTDEDLEFLKNLMQFVKDNYVEQISTEELLNGAYQGILDSLDPYSVYYVEREEGNAFSDYATGTFYGIGAGLQNDDQGVKIVSFVGNSTGKRAGLEVGDYIVAVDGTDVTGMDAAEVAQLLRGDHGSYVKVSVERNGEIKEFEVVRGPLQKSSTVSGMLNDDIGYIAITSFYTDTCNDVKTDWEIMQQEYPEMKGLIVDVRDNLGGVVDAAIETAELFLEPGDEIMHYTKRGEVIATYVAENETLIDVPTVVLVNENSASATEIFAGALQDHEAATLVGTTTYGKGAAQVIYNLNNGGSMKMTVMHFVTPDQHEIDQLGIQPDHEVQNVSVEALIEKANEIGVLAPMKEEKKYKKGEMGLNIFAAQQRLYILGEEELELSGVLDEKTVAAMQRIQREADLFVYDVLDYATMEAIENALVIKMNGEGLDDQLNRAIELLQ